MSEAASGPSLKKIRVWNPAIEEDRLDAKAEDSHAQSPSAEEPDKQQHEQSPNSQLLNIMNYIQMAQTSSANGNMRSAKAFQPWPPLAMPLLASQPLFFPSILPFPMPQAESMAVAQPSVALRQPIVHPVTPRQQHHAPVPSVLTGIVQREPMRIRRNPIVQSVLSGESSNFNVCAHCGAEFRLTSDLVQHMRTNHRTTRYKRKYEANSLTTLRDTMGTSVQ